MSPAETIGSLDRALAQVGEDVQIQRPASPTTPTVFSAVANCRAFVRSLPVVGTATVIISPTGLMKAGWPGDDPAPGGDPIVPRITDKVFIQGSQRTIQKSRPVRVGDELVRVELEVTG